MITISNLRRLSGASALVLALATGACTNPVDSDHHPVGLVVLNAQGQEVASFRVGSATTGQIVVTRAVPATFTVRAVDDDDDLLVIDGSELGLQAAITAGGATAAVQAGDQLVITGTQGGNATLRLTLLHELHEEFFADFTVVVGS